MKKQIITSAEYLRNEKYYRRMFELYPDKYAIVIALDDPPQEPEEKETIEIPNPIVAIKKCRRRRKVRKTNAEQRKKALERDGHKCVKCGSTERLEVHHIKHRAEGGTDELHNLVTLCAWCHAEEHKGEPIHNLMEASLK